MGDKPQTAGLVLIGNELLTGKIRDANGPYLIAGLRRHGIDLAEVHIVSDDIEAIAEAVNLVRGRCDHCFTSGGIGPTHDDVTMEGVAAAFGVELEERGDLVEVVQAVFGTGESAEAWRKMAIVPTGTRLEFIGRHWPVYVVGNVYVLPGIPEIFRAQFDFVISSIEASPVESNVAYMKVGEGELTRPLTELAESYAGRVDFGSYPVLGHPDYSVKVTLDSRDPEALSEATQRLVDSFPAEALFELAERVEAGEA
ncbi:MAG: competence/damage-inducible protein A [Acidimicrobiia bacterium]|nr:competence/damage-inducible protein A [Acidimicrobiia bacterium]